MAFIFLIIPSQGWQLVKGGLYKWFQETETKVMDPSALSTQKRASPVAQLERIRLRCGRPGFDPWVGKIPWRRERLPTPVLWPGESHGQSMVLQSRTQLSDFQCNRN